MSKYEELTQFIQKLEPDFQKFYDKGQNAAGTRVRKGLSELRKFAQEIRNDVQKVKEERKASKQNQ